MHQAAEDFSRLRAELHIANLMADVYRGNVGRLGGCGKCGGLHGKGPCEPPTPSAPPPHKMVS